MPFFTQACEQTRENVTSAELTNEQPCAIKQPTDPSQMRNQTTEMLVENCPSWTDPLS